MWLVTEAVEKIKTVLRQHRAKLIVFAIAGIRANVKGYEQVPDETLERDVGGLVDAVVELVGSDDSGELYQHQMKTVEQRIAHGVTLQQYLRATLLGFPIMRRFTDTVGLPFEEIERALMLLVINAGEAYSKAHDAHVKALEQERQRAEDEAKRLRALSELVAGVAHEINTPLGIITQASSMVRDELAHTEIPKIAADEDAQEVLADVADAFMLIQKNAGRVGSLVKSFKSLSIHQNTDDVTELDLEEVARGAAAAYRTRESSTDLAIEISDRRSDKERKWVGHGGYLRDILLGLLINVERYAYDDGKGPAHIELTDSDDGVLVAVWDEGRGIAADQLGKVFNPFFTTGRNLGACGLGLSIVHNLVTQAMGGSVNVESPEGKGVRVTLNLPTAL
jgi:signal transduction histidine kinase